MGTAQGTATAHSCGKLAKLLCAAESGVCSEELATCAHDVFPKAASLRLSLLVEQGQVVLSTGNLLHSGPFAFRLNPANTTIAGTAAFQNKVVLATEESRPAGAAPYDDLDDPCALAVPINAPGLATAHAAARQASPSTGGTTAPTRDAHATRAATLGALYLGFSQQKHVDAAHMTGLLLTALQLAPLLATSSSKCLYWADVVLGNLHPEEKGPATPRRAAFTSWLAAADVRQGSATTSREVDLEPSSDEESWEETDEEEGEQQGQLAAMPQWGAGACGDDRQGGPPDDPSSGAAALLALGGVAAEPTAAAGKVAGPDLPPEPQSLAAERVEALPGASSSPRQPLPQPPAAGRLRSREEGAPSASASAGSSRGGVPEAGPSAVGLEKVSKGSEEGELGEPSSPGSEGKPGKCVLLPAVPQPASLRQAGMSRLTLRFADPLAESAFRAWHYACLAKLDAVSLAFMMLIHLVLCAANPDCRSRMMHPHWPLGLVPALPLALLLLSPHRYIRWRDTILVSLNAYISTWQLLAAWPPGRVSMAPRPLVAGPDCQYHPASRLPWLAMEALYMDGFMWLLVVAMACQRAETSAPWRWFQGALLLVVCKMRFSVHAPVQLLNFVAAGLLFHSACLAKLGLAGQDPSATGNPAGFVWAAGGEAGQGHPVFSCMLGLAAKVFLLAVAVPLLALRRVELGARTIFLSHRARLVQQTAVQEL